MDWKHILVLFVVLLVGFYLGKKYPATFASIPGLNAIV